MKATARTPLHPSLMMLSLLLIKVCLIDFAGALGPRVDVASSLAHHNSSCCTATSNVSVHASMRCTNPVMMNESRVSEEAKMRADALLGTHECWRLRSPTYWRLSVPISFARFAFRRTTKRELLSPSWASCHPAVWICLLTSPAFLLGGKVQML